MDRFTQKMHAADACEIMRQLRHPCNLQPRSHRRMAPSSTTASRTPCTAVHRHPPPEPSSRTPSAHCNAFCSSEGCYANI
ncbi:hypothetical protein JB92DRAFT_3037476, partial [Gautieria morchelliformis]